MTRLVPVALAALMATTTLAQATPIAATGVTTVEVTAPIGALGLSGAPFGTATVDISGANPIFAFPITGGSANGDLLIEHEGSGVTLSGFGTSATVANFLIDTAQATVFGDVLGVVDDQPLFTFGTPGPDGIPLVVSAFLDTALESTFVGLDVPDGVQFGLANTAPQVVPVPAALPLLAGGLAIFGAVGAARRRR